MTGNKPPIIVLKDQIKELRKEVASLKEDVSYIKNFIIDYEKKQNKKDMIVVNQEADGDTTETLSSSPPESSGWFW